MSRNTGNIARDDYLATALDVTLGNEWLLTPAFPFPKHCLVMSTNYGVCIIKSVEEFEIPTASETGGVLGVDQLGAIRKAKESLGPEAAALPFAFVSWHPTVVPPEPGIAASAFAAMRAVLGVDPLFLAETVILAASEDSGAFDYEAFIAMEARLRALPGGIPTAVPGGRLPENVSMIQAPPMASHDPMLLLISHAVATVIGNDQVELMGIALSASEVSQPTGLLPAVLAIAAEEWAAADLSTGGRGGFHVYLTTGGDSKGWTGYSVANVEASAILILTLSIGALLRSYKSSDGIFLLDNLVARYGRLMETAGFNSMEMRRLKAALSALDSE